MSAIINAPRSIIPACDLDSLDKFRELVAATFNVPGIGAYKLGFELGLSFGLPKLVEIIRGEFSCSLPIIYDHQKAGTDIPETGENFAKVMKRAGVDTVIFFPQAGPFTQAAWIESAFSQGLRVIVGGIMTHRGFLRSDGGYLSDDSVNEVYLNAVKSGVRDFVVPGNKPEVVRKIRELLEAEDITPTFYSPGFLTQGGSIKETLLAAGSRFHPIVGRGLFQANDIRAAAIDLVANLNV